MPQTGWKLSAFWKITLPCAISACGVVAEALRSGVNAVPGGQREAALSLGLSERRTFYRSKGRKRRSSYESLVE